MARDIDLDNVPHDTEGLRSYIIGMQRDFDAHNHDGNNSKSFLTLLAETVAARVMLIRKTSFTDTANGMWMGLVGNVMQFILGNATNYISWDGSTLTITGTISGSVITGGSLNIGSGNAVIDSSGNATFFGLSSINKKAFTNFETSARYVQTFGDSGSNVFGNQGVTIAPGTTTSGAGGFSKLLWDIGNVFTNNPTFTATVNVLAINSGDARCFIGLGQPTVNGGGITYTSQNYIGFSLNKSSGVLTLASENNNGNAGGGNGTSITTLSAGDIVELFIKVTATSIKWYYRKNGGAITLGDTQTTKIPTGTGENIVTFATSNAGSGNNIQLILQCAAYEH